MARTRSQSSPTTASRPLGSTGKAVVPPNRREIKSGAVMLRDLLTLLPQVEAVIPMGNVPTQAWGPYCDARPNNIVSVPNWHPSSLGLKAPGRRSDVYEALRRAKRVLD